ncbi:MAG: hypothetical protein WCA53_29700, partial [Caballeronia sp.]
MSTSAASSPMRARKWVRPSRGAYYQLVKANRGSAGIDDETIVMFEQERSKNLYKVWNRMSSGSYFPPPVKQVEI